MNLPNLSSILGAETEKEEAPPKNPEQTIKFGTTYIWIKNTPKELVDCSIGEVISWVKEVCPSLVENVQDLLKRTKGTLNISQKEQIFNTAIEMRASCNLSTEHLLESNIPKKGS